MSWVTWFSGPLSPAVWNFTQPFDLRTKHIVQVLRVIIIENYIWSRMIPICFSGHNNNKAKPRTDSFYCLSMHFKVYLKRSATISISQIFFSTLPFHSQLCTMPLCSSCYWLHHWVQPTVVSPLSVKFCHKTINRFVGEKKQQANW